MSKRIYFQKTLTQRVFTLIAFFFLLTACSTRQSPQPLTEPKPLLVPKPRIGIALGGGAAKGFAHIGVLRVLEKNGIIPEIVTGTSAGSVVGSLYASGLTARQLQAKAALLDESNLTDLTLSSHGFIKGERLQEFINREVGNRPIEKLNKRFGAVATELDSGKRVVFRLGNTGQAVRASASIPNIFLPVNINGKHYVDGGLVSPVPVSAAREMGADVVIAVDISARPRGGSTKSFFSLFDQSISIMNVIALSQELKLADVIIRPEVHHIGSAAFDARHEAIQAGEKAASEALPAIRNILAQKLQLLSNHPSPN